MKKLIWRIRGLALRYVLANPMSRFAWSRKILNRWETDIWASATESRPHTHSLWGPISKDGSSSNNDPANYTSWASLSDKRYFAKHLSIAEDKIGGNASEPSVSQVAELFQRKTCPESGHQTMLEGRSNVLFMFFAQWFTDGVFRSDPDNPKRTKSNHQIDLAQIYGEDEEQTWMLRSGIGGKLKVDETDSGAYLPKLFEQQESKYILKQEFKNLSYLSGENSLLNFISDDDADELKRYLGATGLRSGNGTIGNLAINTLFLREHNAICEYLADKTDFDDERLFQTARMINIVLLTKLVIAEYINHIAGKDYFALDHTFAERKQWYRENWMPAEFNLLYRWHSLVPDSFNISSVEKIDFRNGAGIIEKRGLNTVLASAANQAAGQIGLSNTPFFLKSADQAMIRLAREWQFESYNDYREAFGLLRLKHFHQLTDDVELAKTLSSLYGDINKLEFITGIFAEKKADNALLGSLQMMMVAYDAFTHIYTNPLLSKRNFTADTLTQAGLDWIENTSSLNDFITRNTSPGDQKNFSFSHFTSSGLACPSAKMQLDTQKTDQILCPTLKTGVKQGLIKPDVNGLVSTVQLKLFLQEIGFKKNTLLVSSLVSLAEKATKRFSVNGFVNITKFNGTFQDHGGSSGVLNHPVGFNPDRLAHFKSFASDQGRLGKKQLARAAKDFHRNPVYRSSFSGMLFQLLELGSLLHIYGRTSGPSKQKFLTVQDMDDLWKHNHFPSHWSVTQSKPYTTIGAIWVHLVMLFWYLLSG